MRAIMICMDLGCPSPPGCTDVGTAAPTEEVICPSHQRVSGQTAGIRIPSEAQASRAAQTGLSAPGPARALTLRLGVALRFGQEQPAQRGQEQQRPHGQGLGTSGRSRRARRLETSRRGPRSGCHARGPPRGRCRAALSSLPAARPGEGFSRRLGRTGPSRSWGGSRVLPPARPPPVLLWGFSTAGSGGYGGVRGGQGPPHPWRDPTPGCWKCRKCITIHQKRKSLNPPLSPWAANRTSKPRKVLL